MGVAAYVSILIYLAMLQTSIGYHCYTKHVVLGSVGGTLWLQFAPRISSGIVYKSAVCAASNTSDEKSNGDDGKEQQLDPEDAIIRQYIAKQYEEFMAADDPNIMKEEPLDEEEEELNRKFRREYYEQRVPDMDLIYKNLDPLGIRKYMPDNLSSADMNLGNVYCVGRPLSQNLEKNVGAKPIPVEPEVAEKFKNSTEAEVTTEDTMPDNEDHEFNFGDEYEEDGDDPNVVFKDELHRYFIKLPMTQWTYDEKDTLIECQKRIERAEKYYVEQEREPYVSDINSVFDADACSNIGITDEVHQSASKDINPPAVDLDIQEYPHNDLLNDIDAYEHGEYPAIVEEMVKRDKDKPLFTLQGYKYNNTGDEVVDPFVYVAVNKMCIKEDDEGLVLLNDPIILRRSFDDKKPQEVRRIPINDESKSATIVIPNEAGFKDQNIRYLADEICSLSRNLVFVPDINANDLMFTLVLNRLIKLIQLVYKVDRLSIISLGSQGPRALQYIYDAMQNTISECDRPILRNKPELPKLTESHVLDTRRYDDLMSRQMASRLDDLIGGIERMNDKKSVMAAKKLRDFNTVKPISRLLQSVIFLDPTNINLNQLVRLGIPTLMIIPYNNNRIIDEYLTFDNPKFIEKRSLMQQKEKSASVDLLDYIQGDIPAQVAKLRSEYKFELQYLSGKRHSKRGMEQYYLKTKHAGVEIFVMRIPELTSHYYMKQPSSTVIQLQALGNAIVDCSGWITSWTF